LSTNYWASEQDGLQVGAGWQEGATGQNYNEYLFFVNQKPALRFGDD